MTHSPVRVLFSCSGVGYINRGIESFFREAFDGLKNTAGLEARLICGGGSPSDNEQRVPMLKRTGFIAQSIGQLTGRSAYAVEQWSSFPAIVREIRRFRPNVVFTSEANLLFLLRRFRRLIGVDFRLLFSNGGPCGPPFHRYDFVHQVAPFYLDEALAAGEPSSRHVFVPYGIHVPNSPFPTTDEKLIIRARLGLPVNRPVLLSVGWIARNHKRMHHLIEEVARLPEPRPFVQLLGAMDHESAEIVELGNRILGPPNFDARSVSYEQVAAFYRAADLFALCSLKEGFGRVYLESLMHGLPTIGHRHPVIEWVLADAGVVADMETPGALSTVLQGELTRLASAGPADSATRREIIRRRFSWNVLRPQYVKMFRHAEESLLP